jgi:hypothetical protein
MTAAPPAVPDRQRWVPPAASVGDIFIHKADDSDFVAERE